MTRASASGGLTRPEPERGIKTAQNGAETIYLYRLKRPEPERGIETNRPCQRRRLSRQCQQQHQAEGGHETKENEDRYSPQRRTTNPGQPRGTKTTRRDKRQLVTCH